MLNVRMKILRNERNIRNGCHDHKPHNFEIIPNFYPLLCLNLCAKRIYFIRRIKMPCAHRTFRLWHICIVYMYNLIYLGAILMWVKHIFNWILCGFQSSTEMSCYSIFRFSLVIRFLAFFIYSSINFSFQMLFRLLTWYLLFFYFSSLFSSKH